MGNTLKSGVTDLRPTYMICVEFSYSAKGTEIKTVHKKIAENCYGVSSMLIYHHQYNFSRMKVFKEYFKIIYFSTF